MPIVRAISVSSVAMAAMLLSSSPALAQPAPAGFMDEIVVAAERPDSVGLRANAGVATGLGLTSIETPASLETVDLGNQTRLGFRSVAEATKGVTGLTFTTRAGAPGVFQSRGFTENALVTLNDGVRIQSATVTARALDPFNYERIEVLRGPSSLLYGEGATAGVVNYVRRKPRLGPAQAEVLAEGGMQGRARLGVAASGGLTEQVGATVSASYQELGSFVESLDSQTVHAVAAIGGRLAEETGFLLEADHFRGRVDDAYWGAPLVNGGIEPSIRDRNYNQSPANRMADDVTWLRGVITHRFSDAVDYRGQVYAYEADRDWRNLYAFRFVPGTTPLVEPRNVESLGYDHAFSGLRNDLKIDWSVGGVEARTALLLEHNVNDFSSPRRDGPPASGAPRPLLDLARPRPVVFDQGPRLRQRDADLRQTSLAIEQRLDFGRVELIGGARTTVIDGTIARPEASPPVPGFDVSFRPFDFRAAALFRPTDDHSLYATLTSGAEPVESLLLLPLNQADFRLTQARGIEAGYKGIFGAIELNLAAYRLVKRRLPSINPSDPNLPPQVGRQVSKGFEAGLRYADDRFDVSANVAHVDATFEQFNDFGAFRDGVTPANVPGWQANLNAAANVHRKVTVGGLLQHVGSRFSNNANALRLPAYTALDLFVETRLTTSLTATLRAANVFDEGYVEWATQTFGQNNLYFGSPRRVEAALSLRF
ncbi:MAG: TonB-dependent receptor [Steroidobacteraceae bacterium]|nr:TonB-dependent receptor [Steroidobacteraceae bacterium]